MATSQEKISSSGWALASRFQNKNLTEKSCSLWNEMVLRLFCTYGMGLRFYKDVLCFWAVGVNNQLLRAPLSSISEAPPESLNAVVAICRHNLNATLWLCKRNPLLLHCLSFREMGTLENHTFSMESLQDQGPSVSFHLGVLLMGKKHKAVCMLSRYFLDWLRICEERGNSRMHNFANSSTAGGCGWSGWFMASPYLD